MKVYEKMLLDKIEDKEKYKQKFIDDIMEGVIEITFPDGTVEKQEPCPLQAEKARLRLLLREAKENEAISKTV